MTAPHVGSSAVARDHVAAVADARRILESSQVARQREFQRLLRRYMSQILYGCTSTCCTTPTCLSCNKRLVSRPFRPPTQLTARALAFYLASQHDPHRRLCPHALNVDPDTLEIEGAQGVYIQAADGTHDATCHVYPSIPTNNTTNNGSAARGQLGDAAHLVPIVDALEHRRQARKDPKSLGQNLYDTLTIIFAYSKHIPSPLSILPSLASPFDREPRHVGGSLPREAMSLPANKRQRGAEQTSSTASTSADATLSNVNARRISATQAAQAPKHVVPTSFNPDAFEILSHTPSDAPLHEPFGGARDGAVADKRTIVASRPMSSMQARVTTGASHPEPSMDNGRNVPARTYGGGQPATLPVISHLTCQIMDQLKGEVHHHRRDQSQASNFVVDYDANRRCRPAKPFVNRALYYSLSDAETLLKSFRDRLGDDFRYSPLPHLDAHYLSHAFRDWNQRNGALIFDSLYEALEALLRPPPELVTLKSPRLRAARKLTPPPQSAACNDAFGRYLSTLEAAHLIMICIHALTSSIPVGWPHTWVQVRNLRGWGVVIPGAPLKTTQSDDFVHPWLDIVDQLEYEPAIRLATRLLQAIGTRRCHEHMLATIEARDEGQAPTESSAGVERLLPVLLGHLTQVEKAALQRKGKMGSAQIVDEDPGWTITATFMEWLRTVIVKQWDGNVDINKWGSVGTAVTIMTHFHANMEPLNLRPHMFLIPHFHEEIDCIQAPLDFLKYKERPNSFHVLQHPMFFTQDALVGYFRAINFNRMFKQFQKSARITNFQSRWDQIISNPRHWNVAMDHLEVSFTEYLVLDVTRHNPLEETLDQLWGQEKRKLLKPLKVRIGILEGEVGLDQGGVTYEFFRLILNEAFEPENGMFTVDAENGMTWFQPASLEPLWKFEMVGVLLSLAIYNGITLPVTFPVALYDYVLSEEHNSEDMMAVDFIADGWPTLAKSFREFLACPGEVADVFMRDYTFSFSVFGQNIDVDMQAFRNRTWPDSTCSLESSSPSADMPPCRSLHDASWRRPRDVRTNPPTVTNEDREQYVCDYVEWLTYRSVERQLEAFTRGFHTCLHRTSLSFFTPSMLRSLVEGSPTISIPLLRTQAVRYEAPYHATHPTIQDFWAVVEGYDDEERNALLEFVTANERIPITGYDSVKFEISRSGGDTESLPTSSTCFGKLYLPEYKDREKLGKKLGIAIRNSKGFGIV
ncbi:HECT-domain-containing protein [Paraphaeosphaeria sporulosa]